MCDETNKELPSLGKYKINGNISKESVDVKYIWDDQTVLINDEKKPGRKQHGCDFNRLKGRLINYRDFHEKLDNDYDNVEVVVTTSYNTVTIEHVNVGDSRGICTISVASVMCAVLNAALQLEWTPTKGYVDIFSENPCAAFNCYDRAFKINGFDRIGEIPNIEKNIVITVQYETKSITEIKLRLL